MSAVEAVSALVAPGSSYRSVPVEHLDYSFIQSCSDLKHLERILSVLRSGREGLFPHLMEFCEKHIEKLDPRSRALRKKNRAATAASFLSEEWKEISEDMELWESSMRRREAELRQPPVFSEAGHLPPVRSSHLVTRNISTERTEKTSCVPRSYRDWERFDVEAECNTEDSDRNPSQASIRPAVPETTPTVSSTALSAQEKDALARREKHKGNDAFRSGDYEEAVAYYSRSLSLASSAAVFNNRAQALIRLQRWSAALSDCDAALRLEPGNTKALLRRATAHRHLGHQQESHDDLRAVLLIEPRNPTALKLLMDETETRSTDRKILIQEVEEEEEEDAQDESREEKQDVSGAERGIVGNTQKMPDCTYMETEEPNEPTNDSSSSRGGGPTAEHAQTGAPPTGHAHQRSDGNRPPDEIHTHTNTEHTAAEFALLKDAGNALVRSGRYQDAVDRYTQCLQLKPHECAVYTNRALCYIKLQRFTEAQQDCDSALQLQPTNKKAFYRRALANKGLKDYAACRSDLQQVLCLDASVTEAEQLLVEVTRLMTDSRCSSGPRRTVTITEVDDDDDDEEECSRAVVPPVSQRWSNTFEFGQVLNSALSGGDLLTCAELLRSVASERLPQLISTQLDGHTLGFIIRALNTHLLHTHPELVFQHLQQLQTARRLTMVLMLLDREDHTQLSQIFQKLHAVQTQAFSQNDLTNLANKYL